MTTTLFGLHLGMLSLLAGTVFLGAFVQGTVGLGVGLVFAPVLAMVEPGLVPALPLCLGVLTPLSTLAWERRGIDWLVVRWALGWRIVGTAAGVWIVLHVSGREISIALGVMVLVAVAVSLRAVAVPVNRGTLSAAGLATGVTGTATSIGGPPIALVLQHRDPHEVRPTLAVFFAAGAGASLIGLTAGGSLPSGTFGLAAVLAPFVVLGVWVGTRLRPGLDQEHLRLGMLAVCACSAVALLIRTLA